MNREQLFNIIKKKESFLCVGLDSAIDKIPPHLLDNEDPVFEFNKKIIDATIDLTVAYKPNLAFYESRGVEGWKSFEKTVSYLKQFQDEVFIIADAKRGDIGNTSAQYAKAFFDHHQCDAVTVAPYMGEDSVKPFLNFEGKWVILLALTSNKGAFDFQFLKGTESNIELYKSVLKTSQQWGSPDNMMYVIGATKAEMIGNLRSIIPDHFLLVPGIGAQGGDFEKVVQYGINKQCGLLINSSRGIIFASSETDFAIVAREKALELQQQMSKSLTSYKLIG
jgi:orotidine-5'-phosphate decarboxylase